METVTILIEKCRPAKYQPKSRLSNYQQKILADSLLKHGQLVPILVHKNGRGYDIIDGHRRVDGLGRLGFKEVEALITEGDPKDLYGAVNNNNRTFKGHELTEVALAGIELAGNPRRHWDRLLQAFSKTELRAMFNHRRFSPSVAARVEEVASYANTTFREAMEWYIYSGSPSTVLHAILLGMITPRKAKNAILNRRQIRLAPDVQ